MNPEDKLPPVLKTALKKLRPHTEKIWCADLTASETIALLKDGYEIKPFDAGKRKEERKALEASLAAEIQKGRGGGSWRYFDKVGQHRPLPPKRDQSMPSL